MRAGRYFGREEDKERTFEQFIDRFIENELPKNPKGYKKQQMLLSWWKAKLGKYFLCHITPAMIAELRDSLMRETTRRGTLRSPDTVNRYLASFEPCLYHLPKRMALDKRKSCPQNLKTKRKQRP